MGPRPNSASPVSTSDVDPHENRFLLPQQPWPIPNPSGDLTIAQGIFQTMEAYGHECMEMSRFRARWFWKSLRGCGRAAKEIAASWTKARMFRPDLWFTYHSYYKSPDVIGPVIAAWNPFLTFVSTHVQHPPAQGPLNAYWIPSEPFGAALRQPRLHQQPAGSAGIASHPAAAVRHLSRSRCFSQVFSA